MGMSSNARDISRQIRAGKDKMRDAFADIGMRDPMEEVFAKTQERVPKETESLMNTGKVDHERHGDTFSATISYGGGEVDYAAAVHEILHARHAPPTGAKYVEGPLIEAVEELHKAGVEAAQKAISEVFK